MGDSIETNELGPRTAHVHGYQPIGDLDSPHRQPDPNGLITITGWFDGEKIISGEGMSNWERRSREKFTDEADAIYQVLAKNLPGGTLHELLIRMLQGAVNLHVVQDVPDTTIKDIAEAARAFVWEPETWESYTDSKDSNSVAWPPEWLLLCQAVEKRYGVPPVEQELAAPPKDEPSPEVVALLKEFESNTAQMSRFSDSENREITQMMACSDLSDHLLIQVNHDDSEWYAVKPSQITHVPF